MKTVKKIVCAVLSLVLVLGSVLPNINANAENTGAFDVNTIDRIEAFFNGAFIEGDITTFPEERPDGWVTIEGYNIRLLEPIVKVYYNNENQPDTYQGWMQVNQDMVAKFGQYPMFRTNQDITPYGIGPDNAVEVSFMNNQFMCEAYVSVEGNPIRELKVVATKPLYEDIYMHDATEWIDNEPVQYKAYSPHMTLPQITVVEKDGSEYTFQSTNELEQKYGYYPQFTTDQSFTNQWEVGKHTATLNFMGKTCDFEVELKKNPIQNIEAKYHGVVVEGMSTQPDHYKMEFLFTFADGNKESFYIYNEVMGETIAPNFIAQDLENGTWSAGKHYWIATIWGREVRIEVDVMKISDSPIKSISAVATNDLVAKWHEEWEYVDGNQRYFLQARHSRPQVTIAYTDGTQATMSYEELLSKYPEVEPKLTLDDDSLVGTGKRTATLDFYGKSCTFEVNVIENPVDHISVVTTKPLIEGYRKDLYDITFDGGVIITVYYKDGRAFSGTVDEMSYLFNSFPSEETVDVVIGKNVKKYTFLEKTCDVEFEVIPDSNPVVSMDAKLRDGAVVYQNKDSYYRVWYRYEHLIDVTLTYKDGTKLSGTIEEVNEELEKTVIDQVTVEDNQAYGEWEIGTYPAKVQYRDFEAAIEVEVVANPYVKATISNEDNFTVVLERDNGEVETYKASKYIPGGSWNGSWNLLGTLETDKGFLPVEAKFGGGLKRDYTNIEYMFINGVRSNSLEDCKWIEQQVITRVYGNVPTITLNTSSEELKEMVLTDADYASGRAQNVEAWLEISEKEGNISTEEQVLLDQATSEMNGYENGVVVDLTVYKQFLNDGEVSAKQKVPNLKDKISITMAVPDEILASTTDPSTIKMVRIHNGKTEVLPCVYDAKANSITFETDSFSTYSLVYQGANNQGSTGEGAVGQESTQQQSSGQQSSPNTGDYNAIKAYMALCIAALAVVFVLKRRYQ